MGRFAVRDWRRAKGREENGRKREERKRIEGKKGGRDGRH